MCFDGDEAGPAGPGSGGPELLWPECPSSLGPRDSVQQTGGGQWTVVRCGRPLLAQRRAAPVTAAGSHPLRALAVPRTHAVFPRAMI